MACGTALLKKLPLNGKVIVSTVAAWKGKRRPCATKPDTCLKSYLMSRCRTHRWGAILGSGNCQAHPSWKGGLKGGKGGKAVLDEPCYRQAVVHTIFLFQAHYDAALSAAGKCRLVVGSSQKQASARRMKFFQYSKIHQHASGKLSPSRIWR